MPGFWTDRRVVVTGGAGFLGRCVVAQLRTHGADPVVVRSADYDLTVPGAADDMVNDHRPTDIVHLAARVGGIGYNQAEPAPLYLDNLTMGTYVIEAARTGGVDKTVLLGTVCSYPKYTPVPFAEADLWNGYPEETNAPYGIAKKAHLVHAQVNHAQYGQRFAYLVPTNLYGPGDKFHPAVSHVIPALIKKCVEAVEAGAGHVDVWGTGSASREYLYVDDAAAAIVAAAERHEGVEPVNLGANHEVTIRETVETIAASGRVRRRAAVGRHQARRSTTPVRRRQSGAGPARVGGDHAVRHRAARHRRLVPRPSRRGRARRRVTRRRQSSAVTMPASIAAARYAAARESSDSWALSPLGLGTTHSTAPASVSGWRPVAASRRPKASRYAVTPATATTTGRCSATKRSRRRPPVASSARDSSEARTVARATRLVMPMPRATNAARWASVMPAPRSTSRSMIPARRSAG